MVTSVYSSWIAVFFLTSLMGLISLVVCLAINEKESTGVKITIDLFGCFLKNEIIIFLKYYTVDNKP